MGDSIVSWDKAEYTTLYAQWELVEYSISYVLNEGFSFDNPETYTIKTTTFLLNPAFKMGYRFEYWENEEGEIIEYITKGSYGDIILTAIWSER